MNSTIVDISVAPDSPGDIVDTGLHISFVPRHQHPRVLEVDNVAVDAGQESVCDSTRLAAAL